MPVVCRGFRIPGPIRPFGVTKNDRRIGVFLIRVAPNIEISPPRASLRATGAFKPGMLVGCMIGDEVQNDTKAASVGFGFPVDVRSPVAEYVSIPRSYVVLQRINLGLFAVLGELSATAASKTLSRNARARLTLVATPPAATRSPTRPRSQQDLRP